MDLKKQAAATASLIIKNNSSVGLGDGSTMKYLADFIVAQILEGLDIKLYSSSVSTGNFLKEKGVSVSDISTTDRLDMYFDGCDEVDIHLNAIKSGAGIHTQEKLFASMAARFIIVADISKFVEVPDKKFPLVLEVLPQSLLFVQREIEKFFPGTVFKTRLQPGFEIPVITMNGNLLADCFFNKWPGLETVHNACKNITGLVETSLFYLIASDAIIAGDGEVQFFQRRNNTVTLIKQND